MLAQEAIEIATHQIGIHEGHGDYAAGEGHAFRLADAQTGVCVSVVIDSGKFPGPAKHLAYGDLTSGVWTTLTNGLSGTGNPMSVTDFGGRTNVQRFYRMLFHY